MSGLESLFYESTNPHTLSRTSQKNFSVFCSSTKGNLQMGWVEKEVDVCGRDSAYSVLFHRLPRALVVRRRLSSRSWCVVRSGTNSVFFS